MMREHEHRVMEWRVHSPPAVPWLLGLPGTRMAAEHVPSHHRGADVRKRLLDQCAARVDLAAFEAVQRPPDGERKDPLVQAHTANSKGIVHALARSEERRVGKEVRSRWEQAGE